MPPAQDDHRHAGERIEQHGSEDDVGVKLVVLTRQTERARPDALPEDGARRRPVARVHLGDPLEEEIVLGHGVEDARPGDHRRGDASEHRDQDRQRHQARPDRAEQRPGRRLADARRPEHPADRHGVEIEEIHAEVDQGDRRHPQDQRARQVALRIFDLSGGEGDVVPALVRPEHRHHRQHEASDADPSRRPSGGARRSARRAGARRDRRREERQEMIGAAAPDRQAQDHEAGEGEQLHHRHDPLEEAALLDPEIVDDRQEHDHEDGVQLPRRDDERVTRERQREQRPAGAERREEESEVLGVTDGEGGQSAGMDHGEQGPAVKKPGEVAVRLAQEDVLSAGPRQGRAQLGIDQGAGERHDAADDPGDDQPAGGRQEAGHPARPAGHHEDGGAEHEADHEQRRIPETERPDQSGVVGGRGRRSARGHRKPGGYHAAAKIIRGRGCCWSGSRRRCRSRGSLRCRHGPR